LPAQRPSGDIQLVTYGSRPLALVVDGDLAVFDAALETHGCDDPLQRFVAAMCKLAMELERGLAQGRTTSERRATPASC
jgi:hypothetical protein